ncbi:MAG: hypothetical protein ACPG2Y_00085 [Acholeplasmataceae bacterium]
MSQANNEESKTANSPFMETAISDIHDAIDHIIKCKKQYELKVEELAKLKQWGHELIIENENLKYTVSHLTKNHSKNSNHSFNAGDELIKIMTDVFQRRLTSEAEEKDLAFDMLTRYDTEIEDILNKAGIKASGSSSDSQIINEIKNELLKKRSGIAARIRIESWSDKAHVAAMSFELNCLRAQDEKNEDHQMNTK